MLDLRSPTMGTEADAIAAVARPATRASLAADLSDLGLAAGDVVIVHSSLSALGWVVGGAQAVVEALLDVVGAAGTIVMPTQSGQLSDPSDWSNPPVPAEWWDEIRANQPAFDPRLTPSRGMGAVAECLRAHPDARRSAHPLLSFVAVGAHADAVTSGHEPGHGLGERSPLARLEEVDALVLLLGVDHGNDTSLHLAEHRATWPGRSTTEISAPALVDGERRWITYEELDLDEDDFATIGEAFAATGRERSGSVGNGTGRLCRQREIVDFAVDWMTANRPRSLADD